MFGRIRTKPWSCAFSSLLYSMQLLYTYTKECEHALITIIHDKRWRWQQKQLIWLMFRILITLVVNNDLQDNFSFSFFFYPTFPSCVLFFVLKAKTCSAISLKQQVFDYVLFLFGLSLINSACCRRSTAMYITSSCQSKTMTEERERLNSLFRIYVLLLLIWFHIR